MKKSYKIIVGIIAVIILSVIIIKSTIIRETIGLVIISFIIAYTLKPINMFFIDKGVNKKVSSVIIISFLFILVLITIFYLIPSIFKESLNINKTIQELQGYIKEFDNKLKILRSNKTAYIIITSANEKVNSMLVSFFNGMLDTVMNFGEDLLSIAIIPIISYYFLAEGEVIGNKILILLPVSWRNPTKKISYDIDKILGKYIISQLLLCALIGVLTFIVLIIFKVDFPILLSLFNAVLNIIPYFGPIFGAIPAILMALLQSPKTAGWVTLLLYIIQQIEGNILSPKITGDSVSMHPLLVIILLIIGGKIGGFLGMVLAVPMGVVVKVIYEDINYYLFS